jgi:ribosomal protein L20A (L18A)
MQDVKLFRVKGAIIKPNYRTSFTKEVRGLKSQDVIEKILAELGSHHHVKRVHIAIHTIEEIKQQNE